MRSYPSLGRWLRGEEIELVVLEAVERLDGAASVDIERETRETMLGLGLPAEGAPPIVFSLLRSYAASDPPLVHSPGWNPDVVRLHRLTEEGRRHLERLRREARPAQRARADATGNPRSG
ncbi:MAG: hypothetical protein E6G22_16085 [Actinobacteria bacterium]|nr:MAG: hypothetical protein E6G22_16085 [Actinomycetota bacterium]